MSTQELLSEDNRPTFLFGEAAREQLMERGLADDSIFESMPDWCKLPPGHERHYRATTMTGTSTTNYLSPFNRTTTSENVALQSSSGGSKCRTFEWDSPIAKKSYEKLLI